MLICDIIYCQTVNDLRERLEVVHTSDFGLFLQVVFPPLKDLVLSRIQPQVSTYSNNFYHL